MSKRKAVQTPLSYATVEELAQELKSRHGAMILCLAVSADNPNFFQTHFGGAPGLHPLMRDVISEYVNAAVKRVVAKSTLHEPEAEKDDGEDDE